MARRGLLARMSVARLEKLLASKRREAKIAPLEREREKLSRRLQKIEKKIARLKGASTGRGLPRKKKREISAAGRKKMAAAQKRRRAKERAKKQKAVTRKRKPAPKTQPVAVAAGAMG